MIERSKHLTRVTSLLKRHRIVGIVAARQVGKTTLARQLADIHRGQSHVFDLEDPEDVARLTEPMLALKRLRGLVVRGNRRLRFEFKRTSSPKVTRSMRTALADLKLSQLDVIHAGEHTFPLDRRIRAVALSRILDDLKPLR
jgi:predicted AAA+ superfamily ATPase